ncbi:MAG TPA: hypothetical protein VIP98_19530 [Microlunatus sp.]
MPSDDFPTAVMIGGPAASGKSTIARLLARKRGLRWYSTDAQTWTHRARAVGQGLHAEDDPTPGDFDRGPMIQADLEQLAEETPTAGTVVEGALITPDFAPIPRSVWLMPSAAEQRRRLQERSAAATIHHGLIYGHRLITGQLAGTAATIIDVDGQSIAETLTAVEAALASALNDLTSAQTTPDRQQMIRYGNRSLADQLQVKINNGQLREHGEAAEQTFDCECGQPDCTAMVQLQPDEAILMTGEPPGSVQVDAAARSRRPNAILEAASDKSIDRVPTHDNAVTRSRDPGLDTGLG